ncbi:MAG TPA: TIR domain-containing protein [Ktedonobacterales bacterium]|nr:TIR domain-containing protein [Ktedonobacterales bacterium]
MFRRTGLRIFISYAHEDTAFVDRLEPQLKARGFHPWVDRRRLEGGQDWQAMIQHAIAQSSALVVVLTPESLESQFVLMEYREAQRLGRPVIPLQIKPVSHPPMDLNHIQWITSFEGDFDRGLNDLTLALSGSRVHTRPLTTNDGSRRYVLFKRAKAKTKNPTGANEVNAETSIRELYVAGHTAFEDGDLERAAAFLENVVLHDPGYLAGAAKQELDSILQSVHSDRITRLCNDADEAGAAGDWERAIRSWQGVLAIQPGHEEASERLNIAIHNQEQEEFYVVVKELVQRREFTSAINELKLLWVRAPLYGDPSNLAPTLGLSVPSSWRDLKAREAAEAESRKSAEHAARAAASQAAKQRAATQHKTLIEQFRRRSRVHYRKGRLRATWFSVWLGAFCFMVAASLAAIRLLYDHTFGATRVIPEAAVPFLVFMGIGTLAYLLGYWRALHWLVFGMTVILTAIVALLFAFVVRITSVTPATFTVPVFGHIEFAGNWLSVGLVFALTWGVIFAGTLSLLFLETGFYDIVIAIVGFIVGGAFGFATGASAALAGALTGGLLVGAAIGYVACTIIAFAHSHTDITMGILLSAMVVVCLLTLLLWPLVFGIGVVYAWDWSLSLITGMLTGFSIALSVRIFVTRRIPTAQLVAEHEAKLRAQAEQAALIRAAGGYVANQLRGVWSGLRNTTSGRFGRAKAGTQRADDKRSTKRAWL